MKALTRSYAARPAADSNGEAGLRILETLLKGYVGCLSVRLWNDRVYKLGHGVLSFTLVVNDPMLLRALVAAPSPLLLVDAYFHGALDIEGNFYTALQLKRHFAGLSLTWREKASLWLDARRLSHQGHGHAESVGALVSQIASHFVHRHSLESDRKAIAFHYDVSNEFYGLWLDPHRVYSCAYFESSDDSLDQAQRNKLEHICRKLRLRAGEKMLDIGCGWGALICWAAQHHGVHAHGITLSQSQYEFARQRIINEGLQKYVTVELRDYRDLKGEGVYDKVSSIGMFEHVGLANLPIYLSTVQRMLRPGGLFLNHGITHDEEGWNQTLETEFINRYVFPDGEYDCVSNIQLGMERCGFEIEDVESLRRHYALTLRHWVRRLELNRVAALGLVDEATYRVWRLYMAACALEFESGGTGVYQILASRRGGESLLPMTRCDLYASQSGRSCYRGQAAI